MWILELLVELCVFDKVKTSDVVIKLHICHIIDD